ncbi:hypothetical protein AwDysgo_20400 [Bacteroidales bacterium]|nr:hypothetical protein AwDysgo_20400 [Bacteroidales bacterium]
MSKYIAFFILVVSLNACSVDYDIGDKLVSERNFLVVNSYLSPQNPIEIEFYTTLKTDTGYWFQAAQNVRVVLKENDVVLYDAICSDSILSLDHYPKAGFSYSLEASYPNLEPIMASTSVPRAIDCKVRMDLDPEIGWSQRLVYLSDFKLSTSSQTSLWITSYKLFENEEIVQYNEIYANNILVDRININEGMGVLNPTVGSLCYDAFMRIKNTNLPKLQEIVFTPTHVGYYGSYRPDSKQNRVAIKLITASKDYDQYSKSLFQQKNMIVYDDDISAIIYQPIAVHSNIKNGLGIFAGYNESNHIFDTPKNNE